MPVFRKDHIPLRADAWSGLDAGIALPRKVRHVFEIAAVLDVLTSYLLLIVYVITYFITAQF